MYQETNGGNATKKQDLLLFFGLLALVILARMLMNAVSSIPHGGILQIPLFIGLILVCLAIYKKRLCSYRYTLFNMEPEEGDLDQYGNQRRNPYPLGTLVFEQFSGGKGRVVDTVAPGEMQAIVTDGCIGILGDGAEELQRAVKKAAVLCTGKRSGTSTLIFKRDGKYQAIAFKPSNKLVKMLEEIIAAVNAA